jgi:hypothetical protein
VQATVPIAVPPGLAVCKSDGAAVTIYVQIYDEVMRSRAENMRKDYGVSGTLSFAGIENVTNTSLARGAKEPSRWREPTLLVHRSADTDCANAVADFLQLPLRALYGTNVKIRVRGLPPSFQSTRHVLELWLPPIPPPAAK